MKRQQSYRDRTCKKQKIKSKTFQSIWSITYHQNKTYFKKKNINGKCAIDAAGSDADKEIFHLVKE